MKYTKKILISLVAIIGLSIVALLSFFSIRNYYNNQKLDEVKFDISFNQSKDDNFIVENLDSEPNEVYSEANLDSEMLYSESNSLKSISFDGSLSAPVMVTEAVKVGWWIFSHVEYRQYLVGSYRISYNGRNRSNSYPEFYYTNAPALVNATLSAVGSGTGYPGTGYAVSSMNGTLALSFRSKYSGKWATGAGEWVMNGSYSGSDINFYGTGMAFY